MFMSSAYFLSFISARNMELTNLKFLRIKKQIIGIITVRMNIGKIFPL
jgi:hypothetical protein